MKTVQLILCLDTKPSGLRLTMLALGIDVLAEGGYDETKLLTGLPNSHCRLCIRSVQTRLPTLRMVEDLIVEHRWACVRPSLDVQTERDDILSRDRKAIGHGKAVMSDGHVRIYEFDIWMERGDDIALHTKERHSYIKRATTREFRNRKAYIYPSISSFYQLIRFRTTLAPNRPLFPSLRI